MEEFDDKGRVIFNRIEGDGIIIENKFRYDENGDRVLINYFEEVTPFDEEDYYGDKKR